MSKTSKIIKVKRAESVNLKLAFVVFMIDLQMMACDRELVRIDSDGGKHILKFGRDVCFSEDLPFKNMTFPIVWTPRGSLCQHKTVLTRHCCEGYGIAELEKGCPVVSAIDDIFTKAKQIQGEKFASLAENHFLPRHSELLHRQAVTMLLPADHGFEERDNITTSELLRLVEVQNRLHIPPLLLYHFLLRRYHSSQLANEEELPTMYYSNSVIVSKINKKMLLFNCVPVIRINIHARDGIIHQLSRPLNARYAQTLADVLSSHRELSLFRNLIGYAQMLTWIRTQGQITILAPTNEALGKLPTSFLDSIMYDKKYFAALQAFVKNHILQGLFCSLGLKVQGSLKTFEKQSLDVNCDKSLNISINNVNITTKDVMAKNGVLHYIDGVNLPPKAKSLSQVIKDVGATMFFNLCRREGLLEQLTSRGPFTIFAPTNRAFQELDLSIIKNRTSLRTLLIHHITHGAHSSFTLKDNAALPTLGSQGTSTNRGRGPSSGRSQQKQYLRVRVHYKRLTVNGAIVTSGDHEAFNGLIHLIDKVVTPATKSIGAEIQSIEGARRFHELLRKSNQKILDELTYDDGPYTLLVVKDQDMDRWATDMFTYYRILGDQKLLNETLSAHLLDDFVMPRGLIEGSQSILISRSGRTKPLVLSVRKGEYSLRYSSVSKNFILCSNGIILFTDALIIPSSG